jgi:Caspase domain
LNNNIYRVGISIIISIMLSSCVSTSSKLESFTVQTELENGNNFSVETSNNDENKISTNVDLSFEDSEGVFSNDASIYATYKGNSYYFWNTETGEKSHKMNVLGNIGQITFSENGDYYAVLISSPDRKYNRSFDTIEVRNVADNSIRFRWNKTNDNSINKVGFTPDSNKLYTLGSGSDLRDISFYEVETGAFISRYKWEWEDSNESIHISNVAISSDNRLAAISSNNGHIIIIDIISNKAIKTIESGLSFINNVEFSENSKDIYLYGHITKSLSFTQKMKFHGLMKFNIDSGSLLWQVDNRLLIKYSHVSFGSEHIWGYGMTGKMDELESSRSKIQKINKETGQIEEVSIPGVTLPSFVSPSFNILEIIQNKETGFTVFNPEKNEIQKFSYEKGLLSSTDLSGSEGRVLSDTFKFEISSKEDSSIKIFMGKYYSEWETQNGTLANTFAHPSENSLIRQAKKNTVLFYSGHLSFHQIFIDERKWLPELINDLEIWNLESETKLATIDYGSVIGESPLSVKNYAIDTQGNQVALQSGKNLYIWDIEKREYISQVDIVREYSISNNNDSDLRKLSMSYKDGYILLSHSSLDEDILIDPINKNIVEYIKKDTIDVNSKPYRFKTGPAGGIEISNSETSLSLFHTTTDEWFVTSPEGYFDCSDNGRSFIQFSSGETVYEASQLWDKYYTPGLLAKFLEGDTSYNQSVKVEEILDFAPIVSIRASEETITNTEKINVNVQAKAQDNGLGDIFLYLNGKRIDHTTRGLAVKKEGDQRTFTLTLKEGNNSIRAAAYDKDQTIEGWSQTLLIEYQPEKINVPDLYILSIGVSQYLDPGIQLQSPNDDALTIANLFTETGQGLYEEVHSIVLTDAKATLNQIRTAFDQLVKQVEPEDTVILFFAGHGFTEEKIFYFLPQEADITDLSNTSLTAEEIGAFTTSIQAGKIAVLFDTCQSGDAAKTLGRIAMARGFNERKAIADLAKKSGIIVFAATSPGADAYEIEELNHGIFTYSIQTALNEKQSEISRGEWISINRLMNEVEHLTREFSNQYLDIDQVPVKYNFGEDFEIGYSK